MNKGNMRFFLAQPWTILEDYLRQNNIAYNVHIAKPTRDFFKVDESKPYVAQIREPLAKGGTWRITLVYPPMPHPSITEALGNIAINPEEDKNS